MTNDTDGPAIDGDVPARSRLAQVSRRAFLARGAGAGAGAAAILVGLAACSHDDAGVFATASTDGGSSTTPATSRSTSTAATTPSTRAGTTSTKNSPSTTARAADGDALGGEAAVRFTYSPSGSLRVRNPYIAVWIEDSAGELVDTIAVWYLRSQKGERWLSDLRRWSSVASSSTSIDTVSGATRTPGDYSLAWDLTDLDGKPVVAGTYHVCIESAREHGPYSLIREPVTLGAAGSTDALAENGELTDATFVHTPA